jgi:hypothetical protein
VVRRPGAAAAILDTRQLLDNQGNLGFQLYGHKLAVPAARLFWVPGKEYNETSPDAQFLYDVVVKDPLNFGAAANDVVTNGPGNVITRVDVPMRLAAKAATANTYGQAVAGLPSKEQSRINRAINEYQLTYFAEHGHYAPETDVVKHVLWHRAAEETWRSILPLPVVPAQGRSSEQNLLHQYMLLTDPKAKHEFLDKHPGLADHFGIYKDPKVFLHNHEFFGRYTQALDNYRAVRNKLYGEAQKDGFTPDLMARKHKLDAAFEQHFQHLLREDARWAGHRVTDS